jgi:uncharacterized membrane protein YeaQ/YmgE (transglycosylase-associated protein family)
VRNPARHLRFRIAGRRASSRGDEAHFVVAQGEEVVVWFLVMLVIVGLIAGFIARALVPGPDPMGVGGTIVLGIVGSFIGGFLGWALFGKDLDDGALQASGLIGSIVGAVIALLVYRSMEHRRGIMH